MRHRGVALLVVSLALTGAVLGQTPVPTIEQVSPAAVPVDGTTRVTVTGTAFAEGAWVEIEPASFHWPAKFPFQPGWRGLVVHGDVAALVLTQPARLQTWDVTDLERPVQLASLPLPADPGPCVWMGDFLLVGLSTGSLLTVDMHDATAPVLAGTTPGTGQIGALVLSGAWLFVLRSGLGVDLFDVTDPANPALRSAIPDAGLRGALVVEGNRLYFTDTAGVQIWDVTQISTPTWLGVVPVAQVSRIAIRGTRLIDTAIAPGGPGEAMRLVDVTDPAAPVVLVPRLSQVGSPLLWNASGLVAQLYWWDHGVYTLTLLDPETLTPRRQLAVAAFPSWGTIAGVERVLGPVMGTDVPVSAFSFLAGPSVVGEKLYWPGGDALRLYDFSDPEQTAPLASVSGPRGLLVADESRAFVANDQGARVLDVSNAVSPTLRGTCSILYFNPLFAEGGVAYGAGYVGSEFRWMACDARGPGTPTVVVSPAPEGFPMLRAGSLLFGWGWPDGFLVFDGSDPLRPVVVGSVAMPPEIYVDQMTRVGDRVYATGGDPPHLLTFDVSSPAAPVWTGSLPLFGPLSQLHAGEDALYALASDGSYSLIGFDLSDPDHPRLASRMLPFGFPGVEFTFTTGGAWAVAGSSLSGEAPYFRVFRPNRTIRNFVRESDTRISFDVPAGWAPGPYHLRVVQPDGTGRTAMQALTACVLEDVAATLAPSPDSPRWRVTADAAASALRLPPIAVDAAISVELEQGPDRMELFLGSDGAAHAVRLKGVDGEELRRTFDSLRAAGEVPWPAAGSGVFGDVDLSARVRGRGRQADLVYTLAAGHLQGASANRAGVDLVTVVRGTGVCTNEAELSYLETLAALCATSAEPAGVLAGACRGSRRLPSLARDPGAAGPVPFGR